MRYFPTWKDSTHVDRPRALKDVCVSYTISLPQLCWLLRILPSVSILNLHRKVKHKVNFEELSWRVKVESQSNCDRIISHSHLQDVLNLEFKTFKVTYFQRSASAFCFKIYILVQIPELRQSDFKLQFKIQNVGFIHCSWLGSDLSIFIII